MTGPEAVCPCGHPASSHDDFGCSRWVPAGMGAGVCGCGTPARQLREEKNQ